MCYKNLIIKFFLLVCLFAFSFSCDKEDKTIKNIIDNSYYGIYGIKKMKEIEKLDEDIYYLPILYDKLEDYAEINKNHKYYIARHIYKNYDGVFRIYYIIDYTNEKVIEKSSNPDSFYYPITLEMFGKDHAKALLGDNLFELMRYGL